jgi:hypothetical protein
MFTVIVIARIMRSTRSPTFQMMFVFVVIGVVVKNFSGCLGLEEAAGPYHGR